MSKNSAPTAYKNSKYTNSTNRHSNSNHTKEKDQTTSKLKPSKTKQPPFKLKPSLHSNLVEAPAMVHAMAIDKLYLDLTLSATELEAVVSRAASLKTEGTLSRGSNQGTFFQVACYLKLNSSAIVRLHLIPTGTAKTFNFQLVLNPNQMESSDCTELIHLMKSLFPTTALKVMCDMLSFSSAKGRTRLESRRVFDSAPVTLAELAEIKDPFGDYRIMELKPQAFKSDLGFCSYIECVRIRGINGARKYLLANCGDKDFSAQVSAWESKLASMVAVWWKPEQYAASLLETLSQSPAWKFIRPMARSKSND